MCVDKMAPTKRNINSSNTPKKSRRICSQAQKNVVEEEATSTNKLTLFLKHATMTDSAAV